MRLTPHPDAIIREAACEVSSRPARASSPTSSRTAHPFFFSSSLTARVFSLSSSRTARRAGTDPDAILRAVADVLDHGGKAGRVPERWDGHAAERIADDLCRWLAGGADFLAVSRTDQRSALGSA